MTGYLIFCGACHQAVEGVLLAPEIASYRATADFADAHYARFGHWPERAHVHEADTRALRLVGRR